MMSDNDSAELRRLVRAFRETTRCLVAPAPGLFATLLDDEPWRALAPDLPLVEVDPFGQLDGRIPDQAGATAEPPNTARVSRAVPSPIDSPAASAGSVHKLASGEAPAAGPVFPLHRSSTTGRGARQPATTTPAGGGARVVSADDHTTSVPSGSSTGPGPPASNLDPPLPLSTPLVGGNLTQDRRSARLDPAPVTRTDIVAPVVPLADQHTQTMNLLDRLAESVLRQEGAATERRPHVAAGGLAPPLSVGPRASSRRWPDHDPDAIESNLPPEASTDWVFRPSPWSTADRPPAARREPGEFAGAPADSAEARADHLAADTIANLVNEVLLEQARRRGFAGAPADSADTRADQFTNTRSSAGKSGPVPWPGAPGEALNPDSANPGAQLAADTIADLVNEVLLEQARRHGVDLS